MIRNKKEPGYVIVVLAFMLVVLLGFAALAVDIGILYSSHTAAQRAADAGALAGAFTFINNPTDPQPATADDRARQTTVQNQILGEFVQPSQVNVNVDLPNRRVIVDVTRPEMTFFAKALFLDTVTVSARAIAEASATATSGYCTKPWFIPNSIVWTQVTPGIEPCDTPDDRLLADSNGVITPWGRSQIGLRFVIKPGNPAAAAGPGQFYAIRLPDSTGGNDYRTNIATCTPLVVTCGQTYGVEPGNMIGPTKQGTEDLVTIFGTVSPDTWGGPGVYWPGPKDTSHQVVIAPIWNIKDPLVAFCPGNRLGGGATAIIRVVAFATIFIEGMGGNSVMPGTTPNDVIVRLIGLSGCDLGSTGITSTESGPFSTPLRLVRIN